MSKWISVKDRLPTIRQEYLVFRGKPLEKIVYRHIENTPIGILKWDMVEGDDDYTTTKRKGSFWFIKPIDVGLDCEYDFADDLITHWQPLPEPPEDE